MLKTLVNMNPLAELHAMDEMFDRMFGTPHRVGANNTLTSTAMLPVDILERDGKLYIKAAAPGVKPEDLEITIDNNVLTIRGELRQEQEEKDAKVYRREYSYGSFSRSIRLPENMDLEHVDAQFDHGFVTVAIPRIEEPKSKALRVPIRTGSQQVLTQNVEQPQSGKSEKKG